MIIIGIITFNVNNMAKFKLKLKLTGLEVEIEGARDDIPLMTQAIGQQVAGMLQPMSDVVEGEAKVIDNKSIPVQIVSDGDSKSKPKKRPSSNKPKDSAGGGAVSKENVALDWRHDPQVYHSPEQSWKLVQKVVWLMHVLSKELNLGDFSSRQLVDTFNKHFKEAKTIRLS